MIEDLSYYFDKAKNIPYTISLPIGIMSMIWGIYLDLFRDHPALNAYTLLGIVMCVHFIQSVPTADLKLTGWGLWFSGLIGQLIYTLTTDQMTPIVPLGLIGAVLISYFQRKGQAFNAMVVMVLLILFPFQHGLMIAISAMTMSGLRSNAMKPYSLLFAGALTLSNLAVTGGFSVLAFAASWIVNQWEPEELSSSLSFRSFILSNTMVYALHLFILFYVVIAT